METGTSRILDGLVAPVRPRYFDGRLLTAADFAREQEYHLAGRRRLTLLAVGSGVVEGLRVRTTGNHVIVSPGLAIDGLGREIIVPEAVEVCLDALHRNGAFVVLSYAEELIEPLPSLGSPGGVEYGTVRETYRLTLHAARPAPDKLDGGLVIGRASARRKARKKGAGRR